MLITSGSTAGFGLNHNIRCIFSLLMLSQSFSFLRSLGSEKLLQELGVGSICIGHKTGSRGPRGLVF